MAINCQSTPRTDAGLDDTFLSHFLELLVDSFRIMEWGGTLIGGTLPMLMVCCVVFVVFLYDVGIAWKHCSSMVMVCSG